MSRTNAYDLVIIGGGIAGSSLACSMAKAGVRVLLLESEIEFRDRVRGEILCPWGVAEIHSLGLSEALRNSGACEVRWLDQYMEPQQIEHRDLPARTKPQFRGLPGFHVQREQQTFCIAGVLMENVPLPDDTFHLFTNSALGEVIAWAPEGQGRVRTYFCYWDETGISKGIFLLLSKRARSPLLKAPTPGWNVPMPMAWRS